MKYISCYLSVATSLETPEHAPQAVNNHCFTVLEERGEDNALCWDNALPYSCRLPLTHETNGMGASPWSHPNEGVCHEVKWSEGGRRMEGGGGGQVPQKSGSGCSTLAAHHGSSQVNVKTRESFAEYWFNAAAWAGEDARTRLRALYFPPIQNFESLCLHTPENQRERLRGCSFMCCCPLWSPTL